MPDYSPTHTIVIMYAERAQHCAKCLCHVLMHLTLSLFLFLCACDRTATKKKKRNIYTEQAFCLLHLECTLCSFFKFIRFFFACSETSWVNFVYFFFYRNSALFTYCDFFFQSSASNAIFISNGSCCAQKKKKKIHCSCYWQQLEFFGDRQ